MRKRHIAVVYNAYMGEVPDPPEDRGRHHCVFQSGEDISKAALQRVGRVDHRGAGVVKGKHGHVARRPRQRLQGLHHVEPAVVIEFTSPGDVVILRGDEIEIITTRRPQSPFEFANSELHNVVVGLHAFAE